MSKDDKPRCTGRTVNGKPCQRTPLPGSTRCWSHSFKVPGRPSKLNQELIDRILPVVLEGNYLETAAQAAGIDKTTLYRWLRKADDLMARAVEHLDDAELEEHGANAVYDVLDPSEWVYLDFRHALKSAEAFAETELLRKALRRGAEQPWQAYVTVLERRHPERWRRRDSTSVEHSGEVRRTVEIVAPTDEDRSAVIRRLQEAGALDAAGDENTP